VPLRGQRTPGEYRVAPQRSMEDAIGVARAIVQGRVLGNNGASHSKSSRRTPCHESLEETTSGVSNARGTPDRVYEMPPRRSSSHSVALRNCLVSIRENVGKDIGNVVDTFAGLAHVPPATGENFTQSTRATEQHVMKHVLSHDPPTPNDVKSRLLEMIQDQYEESNATEWFSASRGFEHTSPSGHVLRSWPAPFGTLRTQKKDHLRDCPPAIVHERGSEAWMSNLMHEISKQKPRPPPWVQISSNDMQKVGIGQNG